MPRLRCLIDPDQHEEHAARLAPSCRRVRRLHLLLDDRRSAGGSPEVREIPARPARYLMVQGYADQGRGCREAIELGDTVPGLLRRGRVQMDDGWLPRELHDLDTGQGWTVDLTPSLPGYEGRTR